MEQVERIARMEQAMDATSAAAEQLERALADWTQVQAELRLLTEYYDGGLWRQDYEADEAGLLSPGLKRGVLSQDGLYDLLERAKELAMCLRPAEAEEQGQREV